MADKRELESEIEAILKEARGRGAAPAPVADDALDALLRETLGRGNEKKTPPAKDIPVPDNAPTPAPAAGAAPAKEEAGPVGDFWAVAREQARKDTDQSIPLTLEGLAGPSPKSGGSRVIRVEEKVDDTFRDFFGTSVLDTEEVRDASRRRRGSDKREARRREWASKTAPRLEMSENGDANWEDAGPGPTAEAEQPAAFQNEAVLPPQEDGQGFAPEAVFPATHEEEKPRQAASAAAAAPETTWEAQGAYADRSPSPEERPGPAAGPGAVIADLFPGETGRGDDRTAERRAALDKIITGFLDEPSSDTMPELTGEVPFARLLEAYANPRPQDATPAPAPEKKDDPADLAGYWKKSGAVAAVAGVKAPGDDVISGLLEEALDQVVATPVAPVPLFSAPLPVGGQTAEEKGPVGTPVDEQPADEAAEEGKAPAAFEGDRAGEETPAADQDAAPAEGEPADEDGDEASAAIQMVYSSETLAQILARERAGLPLFPLAGADPEPEAIGGEEGPFDGENEPGEGREPAACENPDDAYEPAGREEPDGENEPRQDHSPAAEEGPAAPAPQAGETDAVSPYEAEASGETGKTPAPAPQAGATGAVSQYEAGASGETGKTPAPAPQAGETGTIPGLTSARGAGIAAAAIAAAGATMGKNASLGAAAAADTAADTVAGAAAAAAATAFGQAASDGGEADLSPSAQVTASVAALFGNGDNKQPSLSQTPGLQAHPDGEPDGEEPTEEQGQTGELSPEKKGWRRLFAPGPAAEPFEEAPEPLSIEDYDGPEDAPAVEGELRAMSARLTLRAVLCALSAALLLYGAVWVTLPTLPMPALFTKGTAFLAGATGLLALAMAASLPVLAGGMAGLFGGTPTADSIPAVTGVACLLQCIVLFFHKGFVPGSLTVFAPVAALSLLCSALGKGVLVKSVRRNFAGLSGGVPYAAACLLENRDLARRLAQGLAEPEPVFALSRPTGLVKGFLRQSFSPRPSDILARVLAVVALCAWGLCGILGAFFSKNVFVALSCAAGAAALSGSLASAFVYAVPARLAQGAAAAAGAMIPGPSAVEALGRVNAAVMDDRELFPDGTILLHGIKTFEKERIDLAILYAASVLVAACPPLSGIFLRVIENKTDILYPVEGLEKEPGLGVLAWVEKERIIVGGRAIMEKYGVEIPSMDYEDKYTRAGARQPVYLAVSGRLFGMFVVSHRAAPDVAEALADVVGSGISLAVTGDDFTLSSSILCRVFAQPEGTLKVLSPDERAQLAPHTGFLAQSEGVMTHAVGSFYSFVQGLHAAGAGAAGEKLAGAVEAVGVSFGAALGLLLTCTGGLAGLSALAVSCFAAAWLVLAAAVPAAKRY